MTTPKAFDYAAYKAAFRKAAVQKGIDPVRGSNSFQAATVQADQQIASHYERMYQATWTNADLPSGWQRYGGVSSRVELMARRDWWRDEEFWKGRCAKTIPSKVSQIVMELYGLILPPDVDALYLMRNEIRRSPKRESIFMEAWRESSPAILTKTRLTPVPIRHRKLIATDLVAAL